MVAEVEQVEAFGDGEQPAGLGCRVPVVADIRAMDDPCQRATAGSSISYSSTSTSKEQRPSRCVNFAPGAS